MTESLETPTGTNDAHTGEGRASTKRPIPARAALIAALFLALPFVLLVFDTARPWLFHRDTAIAYRAARGATAVFFTRFDQVVIAGALGAIAISLLLALAPRTRWLLPRLAVLLWAVMLPLAAYEVMIRFAARPFVWRPGTVQSLDPDPSILVGVSGEAVFTVNERGMRGPPWDDDAYRIMCIGGSTTACNYLDDDEAWPGALHARLNAAEGNQALWVGNIGHPGHDTFDHLEVARKVPEAGQVACWIILCGSNDFDHGLRGSPELMRKIGKWRAFLDGSGGALDPHVAYYKQADIYRRLRGMLKARIVGNELEMMDRLARSVALQRKKRAAAPKDYPLPDLEAGLAAYRENIRALAAAAREREAGCIFMTQPTLWQDPMPPELEALTRNQPICLTGRCVASEDLARGMASYNEALLDVCAEVGAECIDLASLVPKTAEYFYDDMHFTEKGSALVAEIVARYLLRDGDTRLVQRVSPASAMP